MALIIKGQYVWDFWYTHDRSSQIFDVYFLHADSRFAKDNQHHFQSAVGTCKTVDWVHFFDHRLNVLKASDTSWANTSIWTGDTVIYRGRPAIFYTSRDKRDRDNMRQSIGVAYTQNDDHVAMSPARIDAPTECYLTESDPMESTIHCWRDPYLFELGGTVYMLVAAKRKDYPLNRRGCVALMRLMNNDDLSRWEHVGILLSTQYAEVELPQIYRTENDGLRVFFNAHSQDGHQHYIMSREFNVPEKMRNVQQEKDIGQCIPEYVRYYGYRVIPEHNNIICGFNQKLGCIEVIDCLADYGKLFTLKPNL